MDKAMMSEDPKVTVLMPVYNGEKYLRNAIDSILSQTFKEFEFLIINDGSTDRSAEIVASYNDPRIYVVHNDENLGLSATLNKGLELARGKYIARMDCDDISLPERLSKQITFMDTHTDVAVCGAWCKLIGANEGDIWRYPSDPGEMRSRLVFESVLVHPSVIMRRELMLSHGLVYSSSYPNAEDYELWARTSRAYRIANIAEVLLLYRTHSGQVGKRHSEVQSNSARRIRLAFLNELGISPSPEELEMHQALGTWRFQADKEFIARAETWLSRLKEANGRLGLYPGPAFARVIGERWFAVCVGAVELGTWTVHRYLHSPLRNDASIPLLKRAGFFVFCLMRKQIIIKKHKESE
jgi:glycosyltransferase involved in cell wall biosynthesis